MAKTIDEDMKELRTLIQAGKAIVGADRTLKSLREKKIAKVFLARNCPQKVRDDLEHYAGLAEVPIIETGMSNEEFGIFCKKNFFVSVVGIGA